MQLNNHDTIVKKKIINYFINTIIRKIKYIIKFIKTK